MPCCLVAVVVVVVGGGGGGEGGGWLFWLLVLCLLSVCPVMAISSLAWAHLLFHRRIFPFMNAAFALVGTTGDNLLLRLGDPTTHAKIAYHVVLIEEHG